MKLHVKKELEEIKMLMNEDTTEQESKQLESTPDTKPKSRKRPVASLKRKAPKKRQSLPFIYPMPVSGYSSKEKKTQKKGK
jgi:hypothetical protein